MRLVTKGLLMFECTMGENGRKAENEIVGEVGLFYINPEARTV